MTKEHKATDILRKVFAGAGIVLCFFALLFCKGIVKRIPDYISRPPAAPPAMEITEELAMYFVGNLAFALPESWRAGDYIIFFDLPSQPNKLNGSPGIYFAERRSLTQGISLNGEDTSAKFEKAFPNQKLEKSFPVESGWANANTVVVGTEYLDNIPGYSAELIVSAQTEVVPESHYNYNNPPQRLVMSLCLSSPQISLYFKYLVGMTWSSEEGQRSIAENRENFLNWVLDFLPRYQFAGDELPSAGSFIATKYGDISLDGDRLALQYKMIASFHSPNTGDELSITLDPRPRFKDTRHMPPNREVGGRPGLQSIEMTNLKVDSDKYKYWLPDLASMVLTWEDMSDLPRNQGNPSFSISCTASSMSGKEGLPELAYARGVWDLMLDSICLISELE